MTRPGRREHPTWEYLKQITSDYTEVYLVGGAARYLMHHEDKIPKDWDVLVARDPSFECLDFLGNIPVEPEPGGTYLGGVRVIHPEHGQLEFFEEPLGQYLRIVERAKDGIAIHLQTGAVFMTDEFVEWVRTGTDFNITARPVRKRVITKEPAPLGSGKWKGFT